MPKQDFVALGYASPPLRPRRRMWSLRILETLPLPISLAIGTVIGMAVMVATVALMLAAAFLAYYFYRMFAH